VHQSLADKSTNLVGAPMTKTELDALLAFANGQFSQKSWNAWAEHARKYWDDIDDQLEKEGSAGSRELRGEEKLFFTLVPAARRIPKHPQAKSLQTEVTRYLEWIIKRNRPRIEKIIETINRTIGSHPRLQRLETPWAWYGDESAAALPWPTWATDYRTGFNQRLLYWIGDVMTEGWVDRLFRCRACGRFAVAKIKVKGPNHFCRRQCTDKWNTRIKVKRGDYRERYARRRLQRQSQ